MPGKLIKLFDTQADWQSGTLENLDATSTPGVIIPTGDYTRTYDSKTEWDQGTRSNVVVDADGTVRLAIRPQNWKSAVLTASSTFDIYDPGRVMDGDVDTEWLSQSLKNEWLQWDYGDEKPEVIKFRIYDSGQTHADPKDFRFEGSDDGSQWTTLISGTTVDNGGWQEWDVPNPRPYRYYRLFCLNIHGGSSRLRVHEVEFVLQTKHYASGTWTSPWLAHGIADPQPGLVSLRAETPSGTGVIPHVRYSSDGGSTYTDWHDLDDRRMTDLQGTHVQLRLTLTTDDTKQTPVVDRAMLLVGKLHRWTSPVIDLAGVDADATLMLATSQTELDVVREVREPFNLNFTRASTAYNPETGAEVAVNEPRYVEGPFEGSQALFVEEGASNVVINPSFESSPSFVQIGAAIASWSTEWAYHGTHSLKIENANGSGNRINLALTFSSTLTSESPATLSFYVYNPNATSITVWGNNYWVGSKAIPAHSIDRLTITVTPGGDWNFANEWIYSDSNHPFYVDCIQVEKSYATSFTDGTRSPELPTIPITGVLSPTEGTWEQWVYIGEHQRRLEENYIFYIPRSGAAEEGIALYHNDAAQTWRLLTRNDAGTASSSITTDTHTPDGWHLFRVTWSAAKVELRIDGVSRIIRYYPNLPSSFAATAFIGHKEGGAGYLNTAHADIRLSSIARTDDSDLVSYQSNQPLPVDEHTTYKMADGSWTQVGVVFPCSARRSLQTRLTLTKTDSVAQSLDSVALWDAIVLKMLGRPQPTLSPPQVTHVTAYAQNAEPAMEYTASLPGVPEAKKVHIRVPVPEGSSLAYCQEVAEKVLAIKSKERLSVSCRLPLLTRMRFIESVAVALPYMGYTKEKPYIGAVQRMVHKPLADPPYTQVDVGDFSPGDVEALIRLLTREGKK